MDSDDRRQLAKDVLALLNPLERETCELLWCTTWDGDLPSKAARNKLVQMGLAQHIGNGYNGLTHQGVYVAELIKMEHGDGSPPHWRKHFDRFGGGDRKAPGHRTGTATARGSRGD